MRDIFFSFVISFLSFTFISCGQTTEEGVASAVSSTSDAVNDTTGAVDNTLFGGTDSSFGSCDNQKVFVVGNAVTEKAAILVVQNQKLLSGVSVKILQKWRDPIML